MLNTSGLLGIFRLAPSTWVASLHWLFLFRELAQPIGHGDRRDEVNRFEQRVFPGSGTVDVSQVGLSTWQGLATVANGHRLAIHLRYSVADGHVRQQWVESTQWRTLSKLDV